MIDRIRLINSPDYFTRFCKLLLSAEYKDFQTIDDSGGDGGNDGYSLSEETLFQFHCPQKAEKTDSQYKAKIKEDIAKAKKLINDKGYKVKDWVFITPEELREPVYSYIVSEAKDSCMNGMAWASPKLAELLSKHSHLRREFPDLIMPDIESLLMEKVINPLKEVEEMKKEYRTKKENDYQIRIDRAKESLDKGRYETAKKEYEIILNELNLETEEIDPHIRFRVFNNLGVCELNLNNQIEAANFFEKAYASEPDLPMAICKYALSKVLKDVPADGLIIIEELLKKYPEDDQAISTKANILYSLDRQAELITFLKGKNKTALVFWYEGFKQMSQQSYEMAISSFENFIRLEPKNSSAFLLIAQNIMIGTREIIKNNPLPPDKLPKELKNKFSYAIDCINKAIELFKNTEQKNELETAYINLSGCYIALGLSEEAINAASEAIAINRNSEIAYQNKGIAHLKLSQYKDALKSFQIYKSLGGEDADVEKHIAFCSLRIGDLQAAEKLITDLLERQPELDLDIADLAVDLYSRRLDNEKLNPLLKRLEEEFPSNSQALTIRGLYLRKIGQDGAEKLLQQAFENASSDYERMLAETDLADLFYDQKNYIKASEFYKKHLNIHDGNHATFRYAQSLYNSGEYGTLLEWIDSLDIDLRHQMIIQQVEANTNLSLGNLDKASQLFKDLFEKNPNSFQYIVYYGMCQFRLGREDIAKNAFDAIKNRVSDTQDLMIVSGGYEFIGELETAIGLSFRALEKDGNNPKAHLLFISTFLKREGDKEEKIDDKYVKAFQKSIKEFNSRFPEEKAFQGFEIKDGDMSQMLKIVDQMAEMTDNAANLYKSSQAPISTVPILTGKNSFDVWAAFTQMPEVGIKISFGTLEEVKKEMLAIGEYYNRSIVIDIYPLFLLSYLNQLEVLPRIFKRIYVHQSILDKLTEIIEDRRFYGRKGAGVIGKIDGKYQMIENNSEQNKKILEILEKIKEFIISNPNIKIIGLSKEYPTDKNIINALDERTKCSILLAQELNVPIYCDDRLLRAIIDQDYKIKSFSSQTLFAFAYNKNIISLDKLYELKKGMVVLNYDFISIDANFIYDCLKKDKYKIDGIKVIICSMAKKETDIQSIEAVMADLLIILIADQLLGLKEKILIFKEILKQVGLNHEIEIIKHSILANLQLKIYPGKEDAFEKIKKLFFDKD